jgi:1-acyl-sn-glycerol-3-phosphate acyltransferase
MDMEQEFEDIRPYSEEEFPDALRRISSSKYLIEALRRIKWPNCPPLFKPGANLIVKTYLKRHLKGFENRHQFQHEFVLGQLVQWIIDHTTDGITFSGTEHLEKNVPYLYISNHRDIVLDVAFLSYVLKEIGLGTVEIAIGNNLLSNQFVEDLIRINRSFIVKRGLPPREQIEASKTLSRYINHTINQGNSIWIAQREGRAKDGSDATNPTVIKMIHLSQRRSGEPFPDYINRMNFVPIAISYELDPLDNLKGWELHRKSTRGTHQKRKYEDLISMFSGIKGKKGRVHLAFGPPLRGNYQTEKEVADAIDDFITRNYRLWPTNYIAYDTLQGAGRFRDQYTPEQEEQFLRRFRYLPSGVRRLVLRIYAAMLCHSLGEDPDAFCG